MEHYHCIAYRAKAKNGTEFLLIEEYINKTPNALEYLPRTKRVYRIAKFEPDTGLKPYFLPIKAYVLYKKAVEKIEKLIEKEDV